jgi:outer membrane protein insertion porin family
MRPRTGKEYTAVLQTSGIWGNVRYIAPMVAYKQFRPMHYLMPSPTGRNVLGLRAQLSYVMGYGGDVAPPNNRFYSGGEGDLRGFDIRAATPYGYVPTRVYLQLTNPDGTCVPQIPSEVQINQCEKIPIPVYGIASIGGDTNLTTNAEYRIPIAGPVTFSIFDDFGINVITNKGQLKQSPEGFDSLISGGFGCSGFDTSGACQIAIPGSQVGFQRNIHPIAGTNFVPRMSTGVELSVIMPVINAPFRLYYAYNPLRLSDKPYCDLGIGSRNQSCSAQLITRSMFPQGGAGDFTYGEAIQGYGARDSFLEPRKTFRLTVSTTF